MTATIFVQYYGRLDASQGLEPPTTICVAPRFETGDERYVWSTPEQHPRADLLLRPQQRNPVHKMQTRRQRYQPAGPPPVPHLRDSHSMRKSRILCKSPGSSQAIP